VSAKFRRPLAWGLAAFIVFVLVLGGIRFCAGGPGAPADHVMLGLEPDADAVVVFFRVRDGEIIEGRVVEEAWPVAYRPEALDATLGEALREFLP